MIHLLSACLSKHDVIRIKNSFELVICAIYHYLIKEPHCFNELGEQWENIFPLLCFGNQTIPRGKRWKVTITIKIEYIKFQSPMNSPSIILVNNCFHLEARFKE